VERPGLLLILRLMDETVILVKMVK